VICLARNRRGKERSRLIFTQPRMVTRCLNKGRKEWMGAGRTAFEFGVKLAAEHKGMVLDFGNLYQPAVGRKAAQYQPGLLQYLAVFVIELKTVTVTLQGRRVAGAS
jgi:hypothetical protein